MFSADTFTLSAKLHNATEGPYVIDKEGPDPFTKRAQISLRRGPRTVYKEGPDQFTKRDQIRLQRGARSVYKERPDQITKRDQISLQRGPRSVYKERPDQITKRGQISLQRGTRSAYIFLQSDLGLLLSIYRIRRPLYDSLFAYEIKRPFHYIVHHNIQTKHTGKKNQQTKFWIFFLIIPRK